MEMAKNNNKPYLKTKLDREIAIGTCFKKTLDN
jgi:hypothetical protein